MKKHIMLENIAKLMKSKAVKDGLKKAEIGELLGGGAARFADDGLPAPIPAKLCRVLLCINLVLLLAAVVAGAAPQGFRRSAGAAVYITGVLAQVLGNEKTRRKNQA